MTARNKSRSHKNGTYTATSAPSVPTRNTRQNDAEPTRIEEVQIERMSYGSAGIAHASDGKCIFVEGAVTGDVVKAAVTVEKPTFAKARCMEVVEASPLRAQKLPDGAHACGADWANLTYDAQLEEKLACVKSALTRTARLSQEQVDKIVDDVNASEKQWAYRNKIEMAAFKDSAGRFNLGFYEPGTDRPAPTDKCPLAAAPADKAPRALRGAIRHLQGASDLGIYRVGVRTSTRTGDVQVTFWTEPSGFPRAQAARTAAEAIGATSVVRIIAKHDSARRVQRAEALTKCPTWHEKLRAGGSSFDFRISAPSFFQVNTNQAERLIELVIEGLGGADALAGGMQVADLYCGAGTFTIPMAALGADVIGVETAGSSTRDLARNLQSNHVQADVICDDVARVIADLEGIEACVVDPPRTGLDKTVTTQILEMQERPKRIVYVSCDPQTLARDTRILTQGGYTLERVTPVDMFPQTFHIECVAVFAAAS
jgi:23S rRNA (uracil1939-C5)-methyltransferase